jgi:hypothetical protein
MDSLLEGTGFEPLVPRFRSGRSNARVFVILACGGAGPVGPVPP